LAILYHPAALFLTLREDLAQRAPETERAVTDGQDRRPHTASLEIAQQLGP
jgi:hypothetical protein